ncbi:rta1 domain-containing protein [Colletotrichum camelliae]|nr:rta1 domain-containing protein [Colletotrichum camelliae]
MRPPNQHPDQHTRSPEEPAGPPSSKRRRPHKKSRTGCLDCRKRRVKCGEERPNCRSCVRREVLCKYPEELRPATDEAHETPEVLHEASTAQSPVAPGIPDLSHRVAQPPTPADTPGTIYCASQTSIPAPPNFGLRDLALLHHWTISTSVNITPGVDSLWQVVIPQISFQEPFVAQAILSLAALHMAYLEGSQNSPYVMEATKHHEKSLAGFHDCVNSLTQERSEALFAWSLLNLLYVFRILRQLANSVERNSPRLRKDRLLGVEWIPMIRGIDAVLAPYYDFLREGRLMSVLSLENWHELNPDSRILDSTDQELCRLREVWKDRTDAEVYEKALSNLRKCRMYAMQFSTMDAETLQKCKTNRAWAGPMAFIHFAPQQYFTLLHQRQPQSLALFAYFGAFLHTLDNHWFLEGWGRDIVEVIDELLGSYWRPWIHLPLQLVGLNEAPGI